MCIVVSQKAWSSHVRGVRQRYLTNVEFCFLFVLSDSRVKIHETGFWEQNCHFQEEENS